MRITFVHDAQDRYTFNEFYRAGQQADIRQDRARVLVARGDAIEGWHELRQAVLVEKVESPPFAIEPVGGINDWASLTVAELKDFAKDAGIVGYSNMLKAELVAALEEAEESGQ